MSIPDQVGQTTRSFFEVLRESPLSLALTVVILVQTAFIWYSQSTVLVQRKESMEMIVKWQQDTDRLMASCVSQDVTKMMLDNMQRITETMITAAQADVARMQAAIEKERETVRKLIEQLIPRPTPPTSFTQPKPIDYLDYFDCDPLGPFCMPP